MPIPEPNDPELYWAAGFIEGEGSFIFCAGDGTVRIDAAQKEREPLERLQRVLGGGIYWGGKQNIYRWRTTGKFAERVRLMKLLYPLMSTRRQGQIDMALAKHAAYAGSDKQREMNAKRAKRKRERYRSDPEFRQQQLDRQRAWAREHRDYKEEWRRRRRIKGLAPS